MFSHVVSDMKHSPTPIGHDLIASSLVCAGKLETTNDPRQYVSIPRQAMCVRWVLDGDIFLKYLATTKYNLIETILIKYYINSIDHAINYDDLIFQHWMSECAYF